MLLAPLLQFLQHDLRFSLHPNSTYHFRLVARDVFQQIRGAINSGLLVSFLLVLVPAVRAAQEKPGPPKTAAVLAKTKQSETKQKKKTTQAKAQVRPADELTKLREEFIKATNDYKASLVKLRESYEKSLAKAETELTKSRELFAAGLLSRKEVEASELAVGHEKERVADVDRRMTGADAQIAETLLEADAETKLAKSRRMPKGSMIRTAAYIRYNGGAIWALSDAWKAQRFFLDAFKKPLPVAVFGQGSIHDRWRLDHHNAMDVSLHPDSAEGQALLGFLRANGIPFLAFREAIPGTATGPHIHIGRPSHRY